MKMSVCGPPEEKISWSGSYQIQSAQVTLVGICGFLMNNWRPSGLNGSRALILQSSAQTIITNGRFPQNTQPMAIVE